MRKGIKADSRLDFGELFFDGSFDKPLTEENAGKIKEALKAVRLAPSAVNKQPWRVIKEGNKVHFYEKRNRGYVSDSDWDLQKIDMGIALCHFSIAAKECGSTAHLYLEEKSPNVDGLVYIASFSIDE